MVDQQAQRIFFALLIQTGLFLGPLVGLAMAMSVIISASVQAAEPTETASGVEKKSDAAPAEKPALSEAAAEDDESTSLHSLIDGRIDEAHIGPVADLTDDSEFLRRLSLDLMGRLPTVDEMDQFANEPNDRRSQWIDRLLASPECDKHLANVLDVTWMERRPDLYVSTVTWRDYLRQALAKGQPLNELVAEILGATGADDATRPRAKFLVDRNVESHLLTRDVGRMFFGRDLQCAQCHDHPLISDYAQDEYYGLFAFLQRSVLVTMDAEKKLVSVGEKADGEAVFLSVFEPNVPKRTALPALPDGAPIVEEPSLSPADAYVVVPADKVRSVPRFSRREYLAASARLGESQMFRRNAVNRIWRLLMKRGFVEPPDLMHSGNAASHPLLLDQMSDWFATHHFSVKQLLAEVARTKAYQRKVDLPSLESIDMAAVSARIAEWKSSATFQTQLVKRLEAELSKARSRRMELEDQVTVLRASLQQKLADQHTTTQKRAEASAKLQSVETEIQQKRTALAALQTSAQQAQVAAAQLPSDAELASASQLLAARVQALTDALPPLEQQLPALQQAVKEPTDALVPIGADIDKLRPQAEALTLQIKEQGGIQQLLQRSHSSELAREVEWSQRIAYAEKLAAWNQGTRLLKEIEQSHATTGQALQKVTAERAELEQQREVLERKLVNHPQLIDQLESALAKVETSIAQGQSHLSNTLAVLQSLAGVSPTTASTALTTSPVTASPVTALVTLEDGESQEKATRLDASATVDRLRDELAKLSTVKDQMASRFVEMKSDGERLSRELQVAQESLTMTAQRQKELQEQLTELESQRTQRRSETDRIANSIRLAWTQRFAVASLQGLSPEQLAGSAVVGLGLDRRFRAEATAEWQEKNKDKKPEEIPAEQRAAEMEALYQQRYQQVDATFVSLFAGAPGSPQDVFQATVDQALFWANDGRIHGWVSPSAGSLAEQLIAEQNDQAVIERAYRSMLSRLPDSGERERFGQFLAAEKENRSRAVQDLVWSLLTSVEFRFNH